MVDHMQTYKNNAYSEIMSIITIELSLLADQILLEFTLYIQISNIKYHTTNAIYRYG